MKATAMKPSKLLPHPKPSVLYISVPASGRHAPHIDLMTVLAARAEAEYVSKESTK